MSNSAVVSLSVAMAHFLKLVQWRAIRIAVGLMSGAHKGSLEVIGEILALHHRMSM